MRVLEGVSIARAVAVFIGVRLAAWVWVNLPSRVGVAVDRSISVAEGVTVGLRVGSEVEDRETGKI